MSDQAPFVFYSNRLEVLLEFLKSSLILSKEKGEFFKKRVLAVPSQAMRSWLSLNLCLDEQISVTAGFEFHYLHQAIRRCLSSATQAPTPLELTLKIEVELKRLMDQGMLVPPFLSSGNTALHAFSGQVASIFESYPVYSKGLQETLLQAEDWQQTLWKAVYGGENPCPLPYDHWELSEELSENTELHFFAFSALPPLHFEKICKLAKSIPTFLYVLSPCEVFWTDTRSDKERGRFVHFLRSQGAKENVLLELDAYLRTSHPLLANFGKLGREFHRQLEGLESYEQYLPPTSTSLLACIQRDILSLELPEKKQQIEGADRSIEVHIAPSRLREVEILKDQILDRLQRDPTLSPSDFAVMAPDIVAYAPYIRSVFGELKPTMPFQMIDLKMQTLGELTQGFLQLLSLVSGRWEVFEVMELIDHPAFRKKHAISDEELALLRSWITYCGVSWGYNIEHRTQILQESACENEGLDTHPTGTWAFCWKRLVEGMTFRLKDPYSPKSEPYSPAQIIEFSHFEALNKWVTLFDDLYACLVPLKECSLSVDLWADRLEGFLENHFLVTQPLEKEKLLAAIGQIRAAKRLLGDASFPFSSIKQQLVELLSQATESYGEHQVESIHFCSLLPMRAIPFRVICILGMDEESFPRKETKSVFNCLQKDPSLGFVPSRTDYDRYLFLETALSARDQLMISYHGSESGEVLPPSILVAEWLRYLDEHYCFDGGKTFSQAHVHHHPSRSYDSKYFSTSLKSYSPRSFKWAEQGKGKKKKLSLPFIKKELEAKEIIVDLQHLKNAVRDPLGLYLRNTLGVGIKEKPAEEETFFLSKLEEYKLLEEGQELEGLFDAKRRLGQLPVFPFNELAKKDLEKKQFVSQRVTNYHLTLNQSRAEQIACNLWHLPPVEVQIGDTLVKVIGRVPSVVSDGIFLLSKPSMRAWMCAWPTLLVGHLLDSFPLHTLYFGQEGPRPKGIISDPKQSLKGFLHHYFLCTTSPFPCLPEWIPVIDAGDQEKLIKEIQGVWSERDWRGKTLQAVFPTFEALDVEALLTNWSESVQVGFGDFLSYWEGENASV